MDLLNVVNREWISDLFRGYIALESARGLLESGVMKGHVSMSTYLKRRD